MLFSDAVSFSESILRGRYERFFTDGELGNKDYEVCGLFSGIYCFRSTGLERTLTIGWIIGFQPSFEQDIHLPI